MLGANGAGKSTTIAMLAGVLPASAGDALICGHSISSRAGLRNMRCASAAPACDLAAGVMRQLLDLTQPLDAFLFISVTRVKSRMPHCRASTGVCPQFDVLWDSLTGREHLALYAALRGMSRAAAAAEAERLLEAVALEAAADVRAGSFSGGMRRRLSVALAMVGAPAVVILDEPTSGALNTREALVHTEGVAWKV